MKGLLDFVKSEGGQGLLSAAFGGLAGARRGTPLNNLGRAGLAGLAGYSNAVDRKELEAEKQAIQAYRTAQTDKLKSDMTRQNAMMDWISNLSGGGAPAAYTALGDGAKAGDIGPTLTNAGRMDAMPQQPMPRGLHPQAMQADVLFNGGKNIPEWIYKANIPDMQVSNGYAYDKNSLKPGFLPQLNVAQNGMTSMITIDPVTQLPVTSAPKGAIDTYRAYRGVDEGAKADYDPITITPQGQNPQITTRGSLVRNPAVTGASQFPTIPPSVQAERDKDRVAILNRELATAEQTLLDARSKNDQTAAARAQGDIAALRREIGGASPKIGLALQSEAEKVRETKAAGADVDVNAATAANVKKANDFLKIAGQARKLLEAGPTESGGGAAYDAVAGFFGHTPKGAETAQSLKAVGGWLVSNVPRMEGPQSNFDVANYQVMAADVANEKLPIKRRLAALSSIESMMNGVLEASGAKPQTSQLQNGKSWSDFGYKNQQAVIQDAKNTIFRNPGTKAEVVRRLEAMGITNHGIK